MGGRAGACLVDAGLPFNALREDLGHLPLTGYTLERREVMKGSFRALKIDVRVHDQSSAHGHPPRRLADILEILAQSSLPPAVRDQAGSIFRRLAEAEGQVHGTPPEDIHFHEVGAVDAIVDITGACIGLARLRRRGRTARPFPSAAASPTAPTGASRFPPPAPPSSCAAYHWSIPGFAGNW